MKIQSWTEAEAKKELTERLFRSKKDRSRYESSWKDNEETVYMFRNGSEMSGSVALDDIDGVSTSSPELQSEINLNYAFKYIRFLHAQMSANPPSSLPSPTSQDTADRRGAKAADDLQTYAQTQYEVQEHMDSVSLETLLYGTGWGRIWHNPNIGELLDVRGDEAVMKGDVEFKNPSVWDVWADPDAETWNDARYVFVRHFIPLEQAVSLFPEKRELLEAHKTNRKNGLFNESSMDRWEDYEATMVELYEYVEKGLPWNGMAGRYVWVLPTGEFLSDLDKSPFPEAALPIRPLTDIDIPKRVYGKSIIEYLARAQEVLAGLDSSMLDNIQAHGVVRMILPDGAKIQDDGLTNNGWEYTVVAGNAANGPYFMSPPQIMPDMHTFRQYILTGMEAIAGVNDSMFGKQQREMSGYSMQTAINAGNMVRRRLFNKYTGYVNWMWDTFFEAVRKNWTLKRKVTIVGESGEVNVRYLKGNELTGFVLQTQYGQSFSLDPERRKEEIMQLVPLFEKAGESPKKTLSRLQLSETKGLIDITTLAWDRQEELFDEMIEKYEEGIQIYIEPRKPEEHKGRLEYCYEFVETARYKHLDDDLKALIDRHIEDREKMMAETAQPAAPAPGGAPPPTGAPPMPPAGGMPPVM